MTKFTFEQCLFLWLLFKLAKKSRRKFSCSSYKPFFIFQIVEVQKQAVILVPKHMLSVAWIRFPYMENRATNSLTKRTAQIGRRIRYEDIFEFLQNRESFTGMQSLFQFFITAFYLNQLNPCKTRAKSIKYSDIMSEHIAILFGHLQHFGQTMSDVRH